MHRIKKMLINY